MGAGLRLPLCPRKGGFEGRGKASVVFTALRLSPGDPGVAQRQAQFMSRVLARAQRCHPDTRTSCRPSSRGPSLPGKDWVSGGGGGQVQGPTGTGQAVSVDNRPQLPQRGFC